MKKVVALLMVMMMMVSTACACSFCEPIPQKVGYVFGLDWIANTFSILCEDGSVYVFEIDDEVIFGQGFVIEGADTDEPTYEWNGLMLETDAELAEWFWAHYLGD